MSTSSSGKRSDELKLHVGEFGGFSTALILLAELAPERMTLSQAIFFMLTATADLMGKDPTFSDIKGLVGGTVNRSLHTTYRVLLEPSRNYPQGLGWLRQEPNPMDNREKFLRLTPKGRVVLKALLNALQVPKNGSEA
jgi:hypothetical protein